VARKTTSDSQQRGVNLSLRRYETEYLKDQDFASEGRRGGGNPCASTFGTVIAEGTSNHTAAR